MVEETSGEYPMLIASAQDGVFRELPSARLVSLLKTHGAVFLRGFAKSREEFAQIARSLAPGPERGVVPTESGLEFHGELHSVPSPPDTLWFYCSIPPESGGQTLLCDGVKVARGLRKETLDFFAANPLVYDRFLTPPEWKAYFKTENEHEVPSKIAEIPGLEGTFLGKNLRTTFTTPAVKPTRWGSEPAFINSLLHAIDSRRRRDISDYGLQTKIPDTVVDDVRAVVDRHTYSIEWQENDIAMIDNSRVMHGRRVFQGRREIFAMNGRAVFQ